MFDDRFSLYVRYAPLSHKYLRQKFKPQPIFAVRSLFDIETAPMEVYVWGLRYNNYISPDNIIKDYSVLWWSAKWLFEPKVMGEKVTGKQAIAREDADILTEMWRLLNEADIV